jgi:hypothetical protein
MKARLLLAAPPGADRATFRAALHDRAAALAAAVPLARLSLNLADATPATLPWQRPGEAPPAGPGWDAVLDLHGEEPALAAAEAWAARHWPPTAQAALRVDETVEKDALPAAGPDGRAPGVKFLSLMRFQPDLPEAAARRMWAHHAPLALRVHAGMARYVRDWVTRATEDLGVDGIAELHFPDETTMLTRWFDSEEGRAAIVQDVGHFLLRSTRLYCTEWRILG